MITLHHLGVSQSERIVWLLEELGLEYKLIKYTRDPLLSPDSLKNQPGNDIGQAPFFEDDSNGVMLSESGAIAEYIANKYGGGKLTLKPDDPKYGDYCQWWHYGNGSLQPAMVDYQLVALTGLPSDNQILQLVFQRLEKRVKFLDRHLGNVKYLAGDQLTLADIMTVYTLTTQRYWAAEPDLTPYKNILRYLQDISQVPSYQRAMEKGDPEMKLLLGAKPPEKGMFQAGGVTSDHWMK